MDELFHKPFIREVSKSKKTSVYSVSSSPKTVSRNLKGAYVGFLAFINTGFRNYGRAKGPQTKTNYFGH
jgi:hypothetical protein